MRSWEMARILLIIGGTFLLLGWAMAFPVPKPSILTGADLKEGDLLFEKSSSRQAALIEQITHSPWSHVAVALRARPDGPMKAFEAAGPVGFVSIAALLERSRDGCLVVKRLRERARLLPPAKMEDLRASLLQQRGKPYDGLFLWSDQALYCSELVWKAYRKACGLEISERGHWSDLEISSGPALAVLKERYARLNQPLDLDQLKQEKIVTPAALFASPLLEEVGELRIKSKQ